MKIAACLICRNSSATIEETLKHIRPFMDEINIFDTGSTDHTLDLLEGLAEETAWVLNADTGERVAVVTGPDETHVEAPFVVVPVAPIRVARAGDDLPLSEDGLLGDFSWARERSFEMASLDCDWLLWLDDDDVVIGAEHLRQLASTAHRMVDGFVFFYDYARDANGTNVCALWRERLLRRKDPEAWGWRNAVHEVWLPREGTGITPNYTMIPEQHIRYIHNRPADRYPATRNLRILERVVAEAEQKGEAPDPRTLAYMGTELMAQGRFGEAIPWLNAYLEDGRTTSAGDERAQVFHKLGMALRALGQPLAAIETEMLAIKERDDWAENAVGLCEAFAETGDFKRAEHWAKVALNLGQPQSMLILNPLEFTIVPYVRLAQACAVQKRYAEAETWVMKALAVQPTHPLAQAIAQGIAKDGYTEKLVQSTLDLREALIRWDENWKAHELLENVPYIIADDARIVAARAANRENVLHALKPEEYTRWYAEEPKESTVPDEWVKDAGDYIERAKFVLEACQKFEAEHGRKPRGLDLGCNDFWMAGYLWLNGGYVFDGVELNKASVEKAKGRMERFGIPGRIVQGDIHDAADLLYGTFCNDNDACTTGDACCEVKYDVVTMFEVFEHVPDTDRVLEVMESLLTPEGVACVTTPNGAFEDGNIQFWHAVERKGHLRAWPWHQLAETLVERGEVVDFRVHHYDRLTYGAWKPSGQRKKKVILYAGPAWEEWSPFDIRSKGIGGSETALAMVSTHLVHRGHDVRVYTDAKPGMVGSAIWRPAAAFDPGAEADAIIVSRMPAMFTQTMHAPVRALWCHDHHYGEAVTPALAANMTDVVVLSDWQKGEWATLYPFLADKLRVIRNGILWKGIDGKGRFPGAKAPFEKRKPHVLYTSSPDRGLDVLLELWPQIRSAVEDAELHVYYGWETFDRAAQLRPDLFAFKQKILMLADQAGGNEGGVFFHGRVGQDELHAAMAQARVWGYPTYFKETSCIGAMEAHAAGLPIVTSSLGALAETAARGITLNVPDSAPGSGNVSLDELGYKPAFVDWVTELLTDRSMWTDWHDVGLIDVAKLDWKHRATDWERALGLITTRSRRSLATA